jgi:hypothetical protein
MHSSPRGDPALDVRTVRRQLAALLPDARPTGEGEGTLELASSWVDAPKLVSATVLEGSGPLRARRVFDAPVPGFRGFLDGTQRSVVASHVRGAPIVHGTVAAVVRERRNRKMHTWNLPLVETRIYAPRKMLAREEWETLRTMYREALVDTTDGESVSHGHPLALRDQAIHRVQAHREALETRLAERWCAGENDRLFIDGGISGSESVAVSSCTVGVVKSHRTLYGEGAALQTILGLGVRERTSVFSITFASRRTSVASWYLRLRDTAGRDPMWGLVRVEIAHPEPQDLHAIGDRADEVSRWIMAETSPLALPDARWDKMVYGIRDCEEFLRAVAG